MKSIRAFFHSMAGRVFAILAFGMVGSATLGAILSTVRSDSEFERQALERTVDRVEGFIALLDASPPALQKALLASPAPPGIRLHSADTPGLWTDARFQEALKRRGGSLANARAQSAPMSACAPASMNAVSREAFETALRDEAVQRTFRRNTDRIAMRRSLPQCRLLDVTTSSGTPLRLAVETPWIERERSPWADPLIVGWVVLSLGLLAYIAARTASYPLRRFALAASDLGRDLHRPPLDAAGPTEVRRAALAFNTMQQRLQQHINERTHMLAAITHDLQTPLTRLRLRFEVIEDTDLRERCVRDLMEMRSMIEEGLELARSSDTSESFAPVELDSLLQSVVEDAIEAGNDARMEGLSESIVRIRPLAGRRLVSNLVDNAIKYGHCAIVSACRDGKRTIVSVRDRGPGLSDEMLERVFEPFFRIENSRSRSTGGVGLGLTVAKMLADQNGAELSLRNHPDGGLECLLIWHDSPLTSASDGLRVGAE